MRKKVKIEAKGFHSGLVHPPAAPVNNYPHGTYEYDAFERLVTLDRSTVESVRPEHLDTIITQTITATGVRGQRR